MRALTIFAAALSVVGSIGTARVFAQDATPPTVMSAADANALIGRRCVVCHNAAKPLGGLNYQLFDAAKPDPAVALMISIKVSRDDAMSAADSARPSQATIDEFVRLMRALADQSASGPWTIDLQVDPRAPNRGHSLVVADKRSDMGDLRLTCNGRTRQFEAMPSQPPADLEGLSPTLRGVFAWCLGGPPTPAEAAK